MARYPHATWRGSPNETPAGMLDYRGIVLHIECGTEPGTVSWFSEPGAQVSAHFGVGKDGHVDQFVDTHDKAWAEANGNPEWISIEHEGNGGDSLTPAQVNADAGIYAWCVHTHGIVVAITDDPHGHGLGWHGMGGAAWGGHYDCPGEPIKAQRPQIITAATHILMPDPNPWHPHRLIQIHGHPQVWQMRLTNGTQLVKAPVPDPATLAECEAQGQTMQVLIDSPANNAKVAEIPVDPW